MRRLSARLRRNEDGIAMASALMVVLVLTIVVSALVTVAATQAVQSRRGVATTENRNTSEAVLDYLFNKAVTDPQFFNSAHYTSLPGYASGPGAAAVKIDPNTGAITACGPDTTSTPCYRFSVDFDDVNGSAVFTVTTRSGCGSGLATSRACAANRVQQRLRRRQFFDYLYFSNTELLDPEIYPNPSDTSPGGGAWAANASNCPTYDSAPPRNVFCQQAAYFARSVSTPANDVIDGPVHTNDYHAFYCGRPTFKGNVEARDPAANAQLRDINAGLSPSSQWYAPGCSGGAPNFVGAAAQVPSTALTLPSSTTPYLSIAPANYQYPGDVIITLLSNGQMSVQCPGGCPGKVSGTSVAQPDSGVISAAGQVTISGVLRGRLSVFAQSDIYIPDNLTYSTPADNSASTDALGLAAGRSIKIVPHTDSSGAIDQDRTVEAAMLAVTHSVYVQGWDRVPAGSSPHILTIRGAIAGNYRGAYGAYNGTTGQVVWGYGKNFSFDRRLNRYQPPYFLTPVNSGWVRVDLSETGCPRTDWQCNS